MPNAFRACSEIDLALAKYYAHFFGTTQTKVNNSLRGADSIESFFYLLFTFLLQKNAPQTDYFTVLSRTLRTLYYPWKTSLACLSLGLWASIYLMVDPRRSRGASMTYLILDFLKAKIKEVIASKSESLRWLAKQCDVDYSIIYRIQSGEQKNISFFQAHKIFKFLEPENYISILGEYFPDDAREFLSPKYPDATLNNRASLIEKLLKDSQYYEIFLAVSCEGASLHSIEKEFGSRGIQIIEILSAAEAFKIKEDWTFTDILEGFILTDESTIKKMTEMHLCLLNLKEPGSNIHNNTAGLNRDGIIELYRATEAHKKRVKEIFRDSKYKGSTTAFASAFSGILAKEETK